MGGPFLGNTAVTITGVAFNDLGDVKCRFGVNEVQAVRRNATLIECSSPECSAPLCLEEGDDTRQVNWIEYASFITRTGPTRREHAPRRMLPHGTSAP